MSIETHTHLIGKTQTVRLSETQSEKWVSWFRVALGLILLGVSAYLFAVKHALSQQAVLVQVCVEGFLIAYALYFSLGYAHRLIPTAATFVLIVFDVTVITALQSSFFIGGHPSSMLHASLFCAYFMALVFTATHNRISLSIFCVTTVVLEYSLLYFWCYYNGNKEVVGALYEYGIRIGFLVIVASLGSLISKRNLLAIQKLISSETRYQNLVHRLPEALFTLDKNGNFQWANMAIFNLLGLPPKVVVNRSIREFVVSPDTIKLGAGVQRGTQELTDIKGERKFVDYVIQPVEELNGIISWEGIMTDVSDREHAIAQREEMVNRLFEHQKMESLGTLASGMAHDFNNILQTVGDICTGVASQSTEGETRRQMQIVADTLIDARFLISELMALGRKRPLNYQTLNLISFLETAGPHFCDQIGQKYNLVLELPEEPLWIQGDADYLKRIFQNFFINSRDAMPEGGQITIECFADNSNPESQQVVLRFKDTGCGIPVEIMEKIFDPFFTTKKPGKGTGLGLALVRRIVTLHNGRVFVEKTGGTGTVFRIELPRNAQSRIDDDTDAILKSRMSSTILLIDDDPKIRTILKFFMTEFKYPICEASNLAGGLEELRREVNTCEVAVMDWKLGSDNPHEAISALRGVKPSLIIIVVSGYPPIQKSIDEMNIHKWITKPYNKNQLDFEIQKALYFAAKKKNR